MNRPPFPSTPPSQPSPYRYLGRGGGERPVRLQIIIALVAGMILVAVPLYLWRRPRPESIPSADAAVVDGGAPVPDAAAVDAAVPVALPLPLVLGPFRTLSCHNPGPGRTPVERCDRVTYFEDALARAIRENVSCAPSSKSRITVSYVLDIDFRRQRLNLYVGKSTTLKSTQARTALLRCLKKALPTPDWGAIPHQHARYKVNVMATYPPNDAF